MRSDAATRTRPYACDIVHAFRRPETAKRRSGIGRRTVTHRSTRRAGAHSRITPGRPPYAPLDTPTYA
ncbi:hypothetical protein WS86_09560 [Burkholderia savannae]|nr:hypothetical protein WS86_09560 [Burkholderia savannae]